MREFQNSLSMVADMQPSLPVYCIHADVYKKTARSFVDGFPGRTLYAVKANNNEHVLRLLHLSGVTHFDCASLDEIELVHSIAPDAVCYFMIPARLPGAAEAAFRNCGVRHFMVDHHSAIASLLDEIDAKESTVFVRMAVSHRSAAENLSAKFGAPPADVPELLNRIAASGAQPALAFNVGSGVRDPRAYVDAIDLAMSVIEQSGELVRLLDIGGGFPHSYPGYTSPPLENYFSAIRDRINAVDARLRTELLAEPGRALSAPGLSVVTRILLRKDNSLYLNDGMYGGLWELRCNGQDRFQTGCLRIDGALSKELAEYRVFGPTCDASDVLPSALRLPADLKAGDFIEFEEIGAYSLSGRTDFNGFGRYETVFIRS